MGAEEKEREAAGLESFKKANPDVYERYKEFPTALGSAEIEEILRQREGGVVRTIRKATPADHARYAHYPSGLSPEMMEAMRGEGMRGQSQLQGLDLFLQANPEVYNRLRSYPPGMSAAQIHAIEAKRPHAITAADRIRYGQSGMMSASFIALIRNHAGMGQAGTPPWLRVPPAVVDLKEQGMPAPAWTHAFAGHGDERPGGGLHGKNGWHHRRPQTFGGR
jgi:hypothetical protein